MKKEKYYFNHRLIPVFLALSIAFIAFLTYSDILGYFFTCMDAIPLIDSARIQSFKDIIRILTEPGLNTIPDAFNIQEWYRPVSSLSYGIDYSMWKLNPFGYHLTDIILHVLVSVLVFFLIQLMTNGKQVTAWFGALIFTTHPLLVEAVPANVRRMDTLASLFVLLSLLLFLKYFSAVNRRRDYLVLSGFFYAIAIGAKEIAIIALPLIFSYSVLYYSSDDQSVKSRLTQAFRETCLYFVVSFIYLASRIYILDGIGGYTNGPQGTFPVFQMLIEICTDYFIFLIYPVDFLHLNSLFNSFPDILIRVFFVIALFMLCFIGIYQRCKLKKYFVNSDYSKAIIFLLIWLFLPLGVYLLTLISGRYYLYISVIPFSAMLAIILAESFQSAVKRTRENSLLINSSVVRFIIITGLAVSLFAYSPLIRNYSEWKDSGEIMRKIFNKFSETISDLPDNTVFHVYNFPEEISPHKAQIYYAKEVEYPADYSIKSWLDLNYPANNMKVIVQSRSSLTVNPDDIYLEIKNQEDDKVTIIIKYGK